MAEKLDPAPRFPRNVRAAVEGTAWACVIPIIHYANPATNLDRLLMWIITFFAAALIAVAVGEEFF